jgi:hypothetical protein
MPRCAATVPRTRCPPPGLLKHEEHGKHARLTNPRRELNQRVDERITHPRCACVSRR